MRRFRAWLVWLVVAVIPLQGLAAAVMPLTSAAAHGGPAASVRDGQAAAAAAQDHHHGPGAAAPAGHGGPHGELATTAGGAPGDACEGCGDDMLPHGPLKCCSAACSMVLAMTAGLPFGGQLRPPLPQAEPTGLHAGIVPDGLDRPPRSC